MDVGLLILRVALGFILFVHGMQKAKGWFGGPGLAGAEKLFSTIGQEPAHLKVRLAVLCELVSAMLIIAELASPLGAAIAASTMIVAAMSLTMVSKTLWIAAGGGEYPAVLAATAVVVGFTGPGRYSLDTVFGLHNVLTVSSTTIGVVVVFVALIGAVPPVLATHKTLANKP